METRSHKTGLEPNAIGLWIQEVNETSSETGAAGMERKVALAVAKAYTNGDDSGLSKNQSLTQDWFKNERLGSHENVAFAETPETFPGWPTPSLPNAEIATPQPPSREYSIPDTTSGAIRQKKSLRDKSKRVDGGSGEVFLQKDFSEKSPRNAPVPRGMRNEMTPKAQSSNSRNAAAERSRSLKTLVVVPLVEDDDGEEGEIIGNTDPTNSKTDEPQTMEEEADFEMNKVAKGGQATRQKSETTSHKRPGPISTNLSPNGTFIRHQIISKNPSSINSPSRGSSIKRPPLSVNPPLSPLPPGLYQAPRRRILESYASSDQLSPRIRSGIPGSRVTPHSSTKYRQSDDSNLSRPTSLPQIGGNTSPESFYTPSSDNAAVSVYYTADEPAFGNSEKSPRRMNLSDTNQKPGRPNSSLRASMPALEEVTDERVIMKASSLDLRRQTIVTTLSPQKKKLETPIRTLPHGNNSDMMTALKIGGTINGASGWMRVEKFLEKSRDGNSMLVRVTRLVDEKLCILKLAPQFVPLIAGEVVDAENYSAMLELEFDMFKNLEEKRIPNVYTVEEFGSIQDLGLVYICFLDYGGESLTSISRKRISGKTDIEGRGVLPSGFHLKEVLRVFTEALRFLTALHHAGLYHKRISPDSIHYNPITGQVKVFDLSWCSASRKDHVAFSLAKDERWQKSWMHIPFELLSYSNPFADHRSDLYEIGSSMYFSLVGFNPHDGIVKAITYQ
ncbi:MAG: hypothetical protein SGCHY_000990 [Lobulomycetales sp.]